MRDCDSFSDGLLPKARTDPAKISIKPVRNTVFGMTMLGRRSRDRMIRNRVWLLLLSAVLLLACQAPVKYMVRYQPDDVLSTPIACRTRLSVEFSDRAERFIVTDSLTAELKRDIREHIFPNQDSENPQLLVNVRFRELTFRDNPLPGLLLTLPVEIAVGILSIVFLVPNHPLGNATGCCVAGGAITAALLPPWPHDVLTSKAVVDVEIRDASGNVMRQYSESAVSTYRVHILYYNSDLVEVVNGRRVIARAVQDVMRKVKNDIDRDRRVIEQRP